MKRRDFIAALGVAAAWPPGARAQQSNRMRRIGALMPTAENDPDAQLRRRAFEQGLQNLGWTDGRNVRIDWRWAAGDIGRDRSFATELVGLEPDVLLAGATPELAALHEVTSSIPIVFVLSWRSNRRGLRRKLCTAGRQHHRVHHGRVTTGW